MIYSIFCKNNVVIPFKWEVSWSVWHLSVNLLLDWLTEIKIRIGLCNSYHVFSLLMEHQKVPFWIKWITSINNESFNVNETANLPRFCIPDVEKEMRIYILLVLFNRGAVIGHVGWEFSAGPRQISCPRRIFPPYPVPAGT